MRFIHIYERVFWKMPSRGRNLCFFGGKICVTIEAGQGMKRNRMEEICSRYFW